MNDLSNNVKQVVSQLISNLNQRNRDVLARRFGLKAGKRETLESIGQSYDITRERVRQIEDVSLRVIRDSIKLGAYERIRPYIELVSSIVPKYGGVIKEDNLFDEFSGTSKPNAVNASLVFVLTLDQSFKRSVEDDGNYAFWGASDEHIQGMKDTIASLVARFKDTNNVVAQDAFADFVKEAGNTDLSEDAIRSYLSISKLIDKNVFGEMGLSKWATVKPRGMRDKSYLVLKRSGQPKHFRDIASLINEASFSNRKAHVQTVHNELIKDSRFVLVGRGLYGLAEWGYTPGTVKQVISKLLKDNGPMGKPEIVSYVMSNRFVKQNTVLLGIQDKNLFREDENGRVSLKEV